MTIVPKTNSRLGKELTVFLIITFTATFLLEFIGIILLGPDIFTSGLPAIAMFLPAISVIICLFCFRSNALTRETLVFFGFFLLSVVTITVEMIYRPVLGTMGPYPTLSTLLASAGFLVVLIFNLKKQWRKRLESARLSIGENRRYYLFLIIFPALYSIGMLISYLGGLSAPGLEFNPGQFLKTIGISFVSLAFTWPVYFGEEYGWRYYLQDRLFALTGGYKGVVLLGTIWGLWHLPLMIMGLNFPGDPVVPANLIYLLYTIILSIIFGYVVIKTRSVLIAVGLHGLTDIMVNAGRTYIAGANTIVSFLPLLIVLAIFAAILLRSKVWKTSTN